MLLRNTTVTINGLDTFTAEKPRVLHLKVNNTENLLHFRQAITPFLKPFRNDDKKTFHPHLTLARMKTREAQKMFRRKQTEIEKLLTHVSWTFTISELVLYGVPKGKAPGHQEKLFAIPL